MSSVSMIVLCASALFVQSMSAECLYASAPAAWAPALAPSPISWASDCGSSNIGNIISANSALSDGGDLDVITSSPLSPTGISVLSENNISGDLIASGNLPVLAAVAVQGSLPTDGSAGTTYSCGNGQVGISSDSLAAAGLSASNNAYASGAYGTSSGAYGTSCGCY